MIEKFNIHIFFIIGECISTIQKYLQKYLGYESDEAMTGLLGNMVQKIRKQNNGGELIILINVDWDLFMAMWLAVLKLAMIRIIKCFD